MTIKLHSQYWLASISNRDFRLDFDRVEVVSLSQSGGDIIVIRVNADGMTYWGEPFRVEGHNLYTDLKEALKRMRAPIANLLHNIDDFLNNRAIGENGVMGELHVPADKQL